MSVLFLCSLTFSLYFGETLATNGQAVESKSDVSQLVREGVNKYQAGNFPAAIDKWNSALNVYPKDTVNANVAVINENIARAYRQLGQSEKALKFWEPVIAYHRGTNNWQKLARSQTEEAQEYINMGQPMKAIAILCGTYYQNSSDTKTAPQTALEKSYECKQESALEIARREKDKKGEVAALGSLGEAYHKRGDYAFAIQEYLKPALNIGYPEYKFALSNSLGKSYLSDAQLWAIRANSANLQENKKKEEEFTANSASYYQQALNYLQNSLKIARQDNNQSAQMQVLLNLIQLSYRSQPLRIITKPQAVQFIDDALQIVDKLPLSRSKVYAKIDLANLPSGNQSIAASRTSCQILRLPDTQVKALLESAVKSSQKLQDNRSQSFAFGTLGHYFECHKKYNQALELTQKAIINAEQDLQTGDSLYLWEWQAGRIFSLLGNEEKATAAYQRAYNLLTKVREDILLADRDLQFDFRDIIKPFYTQLAALNLNQAAEANSLEAQNKQLSQAVTTVNSLQVAELQNYFGNDCVLTTIDETTINNLLGKDTAVFNSLILDKGVAIVVSFSDGQGKYKRKWHWVQENDKLVSLEVVRDSIKNYRTSLVDSGLDRVYQPGKNIEAQRLYKWIIKDFEDELKQKGIKNLVFIQDGILRTVPMASLYSREDQKFLIEKFAIAITPSLSLTAPKKLESKENEALILGLYQSATVDSKEFSALSNVKSEIKEVKRLFPKKEPLVNQQFLPEAVEEELAKVTYPIIHVATHAQFGTIPTDTFIVTGNNQKLTINQLEKALRQTNNQSDTAVELLTLSACETAFGDERAALGLAGVAVQAGVRSALASLWTVDDESTSILIAEFYRQLKTGMSKAQALQAAQVKLIQADKDKGINSEYNNPYYWSPFILIGNWL
ncbi:MAG: CHAT domain-containing protein [Cyanobacteria bacterium P01_D01_bin.116]